MVNFAFRHEKERTSDHRLLMSLKLPVFYLKSFWNQLVYHNLIQHSWKFPDAVYCSFKLRCEAVQMIQNGKWNINLNSEQPNRKTVLTYLFRHFISSWNFPVDWTEKLSLLQILTRVCRNSFAKGKQPQVLNVSFMKASLLGRYM